MGYQMQNGTYANTRPLTLAASAARTANGSGPAVELGDQSVARVKLDVTAVTGTNPTLDAYVETSADGAAWRIVGTFAQKTAVSYESVVFGPCDRYVRAAWEIGGTSTPTFTFSIAGESA